MKLKKLCAFALCLSLAVGTAGVTSVSAQENEPYITHSLPITMKIGEALRDLPDYNIYYHNLTPGETVLPLYDMYWNSELSNTLDIPSFLPRAWGARKLDVDKDGNVSSPNLNWGYAFYTPGELTFNFWYQGYDKETDSTIGDIIYVGEPVTITIEEPVIETNAPKTIEQGETFDLTTALTNTALTNQKLADYDNPDNWEEIGESMTYTPAPHTPAYRPTVTVIEGQDLVSQSNQDYSNTLCTSETLSFKGTGTVKLKVSYNQIMTCESCQVWNRNLAEGEYSAYNPEKIITIQVTDKAPPVPEKPDTTKLQQLVTQYEKLNASHYTSDSFKNFTKALERAKAVLQNSDVTEEEIAQAQKELMAAVDGLKKVEESISSSNSENNDSKPEDTSSKPETSSTSTESNNPQTGNNSSFISIVFLLAISSVAGFLLLAKKKKIC